MKCNQCQKELIGNQKKWCSQKCKNLCSNHKHQNYKSQNKRGNERKKELVDLSGGSCKICGYNKSYRALCFHHRDPSKKSFSLDLRRLSNRSWEKILEEFEKCDLLCSNCHMELHDTNLKE
jgi:hypothetical protein